jgi:acetyl esterase/lipase
MVGSPDGFVDEDVAYAERLREAGVEVDLHVYAGGFHGFDIAAAGAPLAARANRDVEDWLRAHL